MNGAEGLVRMAVAAGVEVCFANPGTTEMPLVAAFDAVPGIRAILGLFEGVCTGAADGYGRMTHRPAMTLLHLGPGFANGIANLHNARRARTPIFNVIGDHATWHQAADAPLASDIESLARPVSAWVRSNRSAEELAKDVAEAIAASNKWPGQIATLIVPHDCQLNAARHALPHGRASVGPQNVEERNVSSVAETLRNKQPAAMLLGGRALERRGLMAAARIAAVTGCKLICETFSARLERGAGLPPLMRLPYFPEQAIEMLSKFQSLVLAGAKDPVSFFGYPGLPSRLAPATTHVATLATPEHDAATALESLADLLGAPPDAGTMALCARPPQPSGPLTLENMAAAVASLQPEGAIIVDEGNTSSAAYFALSAGAPWHSYLNNTGGSIGMAMPCATGAAIACPQRPVIAIEADGSAAYTLQALWTQAREKLNVTTLLCANHSYKVLGIELHRAKIDRPGPQARSMIQLTEPKLDWVQAAQGMGVAAVRVETAEALMATLARALAEPGPHFIEMSMAA